MSFSKLATVFVPSPNRNKQRTNKVIYFTPHCMVGQMTAKRCGELFARSSYQASSNYGIGTDGKIGGYVDEEDRSWCTSSAWNDNRAITVECASDTKHPYAMNQKVWDSLVDLAVDICQRYGKNKMLWFNDKKTALGYSPKSNEMVITAHRWFAAKACPGDWLYNRLGKLADEVNKKLNSQVPTPKLVVEDPKHLYIPSEDDRCQLVWTFLATKGLNDYAIAGLMGNLYCESAIRPNNLQNSFETKLGMTDKGYTDAVNKGTYKNFIHDGAGYGLAQWTFWSRKQALLYFAEKKMLSIDNLKMQLEFLWEELGAYKHVMDILSKASSIKEACNVVLREYERPAVVVKNDKAGITKALNARTAAGKDFYDKFSIAGKQLQPNKKSLGYFVQYGAFSTKNNAKKRLYNIESKDLNGEVVKFDGYYRVIDGYYDTVEEANKIAEKARAAGYNVIIKERLK